jgi:hypothetical protein
VNSVTSDTWWYVRKKRCPDIFKVITLRMSKGTTKLWQSLLHYSIIFNLRTAAFKSYCAIWVRRSNFRHQTSPRENTQPRKVELWTRNVREFCLNAYWHLIFRNLLHAVKLRHGTDGFTSPPKEGVLRIFFALKIRRLRPGANPRSWVPKASTLPLDRRSRLQYSNNREIN